MSQSDEIPTVALTPSVEAEPVPASIDELEDSAELAKLPVVYQIADLRRRFREGARRIRALKEADEGHAKQIAGLHNIVAPRTTPARALRYLGWVFAAALAAAGWLAALDRFAKSDDVKDLQHQIHALERQVSGLEGFIKAKVP